MTTRTEAGKRLLDSSRNWIGVPVSLHDRVLDIEREAAALALHRIREGVAGLGPIVRLNRRDEPSRWIDRAAVLLLIDTEIGAPE